MAERLKNKQRTAYLGVRLYPEQKASIRQTAENYRISMSEYLLKLHELASEPEPELETEKIGV